MTSYTDKIRFSSGTELLDLVRSELPQAHYETVHRGTEVRDLKNSGNSVFSATINNNGEENHVAVVNNDTGHTATITTDSYTIVQHEEAIKPVVRAVQDLGLNIKGTIYKYNFGDYVSIYSKFYNKGFQIKNDSDYKLGFSIRNSINRTSSVSLSGYFERMVCSNGMFVKDLVAKPIKRKHIGNIDFQKVTKEWIESLINNSEELKQTLIKANSIVIKKFDINQILENLGVPETHRDKIIERADFEENPTKKALYDALTSYISEKMEDKSTQTIDKYQGIAEKLLTSKIKKIVE